MLKMSRMFPDGLFLEQSVRSGRDEVRVGEYRTEVWWPRAMKFGDV